VIRISIVVAILLMAITGHAQESTPTLLTPPGTKLYDYGSEWRSWTDGARDDYIIAFNEGTRRALRDTYGLMSQERQERLRKRLAMEYEPYQLRDVMTSLYRDPSNTFIPYAEMIYLARDKLNGEDIEARLRLTRRGSRGYVPE
jgi:hypothetical protein